MGVDTREYRTQKRTLWTESGRCVGRASESGEQKLKSQDADSRIWRRRVRLSTKMLSLFGTWQHVGGTVVRVIVTGNVESN